MIVDTKVVAPIPQMLPSLKELWKSAEESLLESNTVTLVVGEEEHTSSLPMLEKLVDAVNQQLGKSYNSCILLRNPYSPIFFQHSQWGDSFLMGCITGEEWSLSMIRDDRQNTSSFSSEWIEIGGEMRFTQPICPTSVNTAILFILIEVDSFCLNDWLK